MLNIVIKLLLFFRQPSKFYSINPMKQQRQESSYKKLNELRKSDTKYKCI